MFHLSPRDWGSPQHRDRIYIVGIRQSWLHTYVANESLVQTCLTGIMASLSGMLLAPLDWYFLPESSPLIQQDETEARVDYCMSLGKVGDAVLANGGVMHSRVLAPRKRCRTDQSTCKYWHKHEEEYARQGLWWAGPSHNVTAALLRRQPCLGRLTDRQCETLTLTKVHTFPLKRHKTLSLSQNAWRVRSQEDGIGAISPTAEFFLASRARFLHCQEAFTFQGLEAIFTPELLEEFGKKTMLDLAGNAMETSCLMATTIALMTALAEVYTGSLPSALDSAAMASLSSSSDSDSESVSELLRGCNSDA